MMNADGFTSAHTGQVRHPSGTPARWRPGHWAMLALMGLAGCANPPVPPAQAPPPASGPPVGRAAEPVESAAPARTPRSSASRAADYKIEVAERIHAASESSVYEGAPPPVLRSIVVMSLAIDRSGNLVESRVVRDNGDADMVRAALESARRAAPYPVPSSGVAPRGRVSFFETWLFRDDGRFRLRSLAQAQQPGE